MSKTRIVSSTINGNLFDRVKDWYLTKFCQNYLSKQVNQRLNRKNGDGIPPNNKLLGILPNEL